MRIVHTAPLHRTRHLRVALGLTAVTGCVASCGDSGSGQATADASAVADAPSSPSDGGDAGGPSALFRMDYSVAAAPIGGWTDRRPDNADHTMSHEPAAGPAGQDVYRLVLDHTGPNGGDNYWGHNRRFTGAPFAYGDRVYFRWRFRWLPDTDCRAYEQGGTGLLGVFRNKVLIVNDHSSSATSRFIMNFNCDPLTHGYWWTLAKGGGVDPANTSERSDFGSWVDVQVELQYSSAAGVLDGAYRLWIDNNTRLAPAAEASGIALHADLEPGYVQFGAYFNNGVFSDGHIGWQHTDFTISDEFDPNWH